MQIQAETKVARRGKWCVAALIAVSIVLTILRCIYIPKTNPRQADPGNPFYSKPATTEAPDLDHLEK